MTNSNHERAQITARLAVTIAILLIALATLSLQAQTFTVIHTFTGAEGGNPAAGLTIDRVGNLYGTAEYGGGHACLIAQCGSVFKLAHVGSGWVVSVLHAFQGGADGQFPQARVSFGPAGTLYGTTAVGDNGIVFNLRPPATFCHSVSCPWTKSALFLFPYGSNNTGYLLSGDLTFDAAGNIYGTTVYGGLPLNCSQHGCGVIYQLTHSGETWTENILYEFTGINDGGNPASGVIFDQAGNLYGTAPIGRDNGRFGVVYQLSHSGSGWTQTVLYSFRDAEDGGGPYGGLIFDAVGNFYGTSVYGGSGGGGTVFELSPSGGSWNFNLLSSLSGDPQNNSGPRGNLVRDSVGNLYGTTLYEGAYGYGNVFKLTPSSGGWTYTSLHDFTGGSDGAYPYDGLVSDGNGHLYGTTYFGGTAGVGCVIAYYGQLCGVAFEITP